MLRATSRPAGTAARHSQDSPPARRGRASCGSRGCCASLPAGLRPCRPAPLRLFRRRSPAARRRQGPGAAGPGAAGPRFPFDVNVPPGRSELPPGLGLLPRPPAARAQGDSPKRPAPAGAIPLGPAPRPRAGQCGAGAPRRAAPGPAGAAGSTARSSAGSASLGAVAAAAGRRKGGR